VTRDGPSSTNFEIDVHELAKGSGGPCRERAYRGSGRRRNGTNLAIGATGNGRRPRAKGLSNTSIMAVAHTSVSDIGSDRQDAAGARRRRSRSGRARGHSSGRDRVRRGRGGTGRDGRGRGGKRWTEEEARQEEKAIVDAKGQTRAIGKEEATKSRGENGRDAVREQSAGGNEVRRGHRGIKGGKGGGGRGR
jgi:hypothetical protein